MSEIFGHLEPASDSAERPSIFSYSQPQAYIRDMLNWHNRSSRKFSVNKLTHDLHGLSPALVSRVAKGVRRLTRDKVPAFSQLLGLTLQEGRFLDQLALQHPFPNASSLAKPLRSPSMSDPQLFPKNHLFADWLQVYVKDTFCLKSPVSDAVGIHQRLNGLASVSRIRKALNFLLREGFLRRTVGGRLVINERHSVSTDDIPNAHLRAFNKKALEIARLGIDNYDLTERRSDTYIFALNEEHVKDLRDLLRDCMDRVVAFREQHPDDNERLFQVTMHLTPITGKR